MILHLPAHPMSPAGVHFSVSGGLNIQKRRVETLQKLFIAHGNEMFGTTHMGHRLKAGMSVILLRGKHFSIDSDCAAGQVLNDNEDALLQCGIQLLSHSEFTSLGEQDPDLIIDIHAIRGDPFLATAA